ncbi:MAG: hypothetical protein M1331_01770 [Candidatus Marsarchaeota archaeon]|nr:hypothetical protein [Candidatus Marsarchaeota archaeon]MCL5106107.1 hypothetical protein [Candidatus Marsarchaeota archaeon]
MNIKYWEFEDAPIKERIKKPRIKDIANVLFENELEAYRFSKLMVEVKKSKKLRLNEVRFLPKTTAKRYLDYAVQIGLLKHEDMGYELTDRFSKPLKNLALYIKAWSESDSEEDLDLEFPTVRKQ